MTPFEPFSEASRPLLDLLERRGRMTTEQRKIAASTQKIQPDVDWRLSWRAALHNYEKFQEDIKKILQDKDKKGRGGR